MDFAFALFVGLVVTGAIVLWDRMNRSRMSDDDGTAPKTVGVVVDYARAFFPVILIVFVLRSFVVEPFRIPSGSMLPSLYIGDFILVSKFSYGIRLPVINHKIVSVGKPGRGEVLVFRYPHDKKTNFIKRVVGIPGDIIDYRNKRLRINGNVVSMDKVERHSLKQLGQANAGVIEYLETLGHSKHGVLLDENQHSRDMRISVPPGHFFVMGDNRDHSNDSRFWGFVPDDNIVGRAFLVWFSWDWSGGSGVNWSRIGNAID